LNKSFIKNIVDNGKIVKIVVEHRLSSDKETFRNLFGNRPCVLLIEIIQLLEHQYIIVKSDNEYFMYPQSEQLKYGSEIVFIGDLINEILDGHLENVRKGGNNIYKVKIGKYKLFLERY